MTTNDEIWGTAPSTEDGGRPVLGGAEILDRLREIVTRYVVLPSAAATDTVVLWIVATHAVNCWQHATRLVIKSPEKRCGKSRLLDVIEGTCARPLMTVNATVSAIFRSIGDSDQPTLLVDEADSIFGTRIRAELNEDLRGLLNAGFGRGRPTLRTVGAQHQVVPFPTFAMVALACIGALPDTIEDRAVVITQRRRASGEIVQQFRQRKAAPILHGIRDTIADWVASIEGELRDAEPENPLEDRAADVWEPLIAIADAAGGRWPEAARAAALVMSADSDEADAERSLGTRLLGDIRELFDSFGVGFMTSADLTSRLRHLLDAPWSDLDLTTRRLATRLKPYGITPGHNSAKTERGYQRDSFSDAWCRYLPVHRPEASERPERPETKALAADTQQPADTSIRPHSAEVSERPPQKQGPADVRTHPDTTPREDCSECQRRYAFGSGPCPTHSPQLTTA